MKRRGVNATMHAKKSFRKKAVDARWMRKDARRRKDARWMRKEARWMK